jgi:AcrR family transcriptional regulator
MAEAQTRDSRQAVSDRNVGAILDGAERLLQRGEQPSISAVASEAGVSRVTVYSHFKDRRRLLETLVERTVQRASEALQEAEPERGPADEALSRVVAAGWERLGRNEAIARAAAAELSTESRLRAHESIQAVLGRLAERGRRGGEFRTDLPVDWLVISSLGLIHSAADAVRAGELDAETACEALSVTVADLFAGPGR